LERVRKSDIKFGMHEKRGIKIRLVTVHSILKENVEVKKWLERELYW